jgi:hypothetical protein
MGIEIEAVRVQEHNISGAIGHEPRRANEIRRRSRLMKLWFATLDSQLFIAGT